MFQLNNNLGATLRSQSLASVLPHSDNSGHTATLRSAKIVPFGNDFVCPRPLYEIALDVIELAVCDGLIKKSLYTFSKNHNSIQSRNIDDGCAR